MAKITRKFVLLTDINKMNAMLNMVARSLKNLEVRRKHAHRGARLVQTLDWLYVYCYTVGFDVTQEFGYMFYLLMCGS